MWPGITHLPHLQIHHPVFCGVLPCLAILMVLVYIVVHGHDLREHVEEFAVVAQVLTVPAGDRAALVDAVMPVEGACGMCSENGGTCF